MEWVFWRINRVHEIDDDDEIDVHELHMSTFEDSVPPNPATLFYIVIPVTTIIRVRRGLHLCRIWSPSNLSLVPPP